jgi:hypothetical protein
MRRVRLFALVGPFVLSALAGSFWLGRISGGRVASPFAGDEQRELRQRLSDLGAAVEGTRRSLVWIGERVGKLPRGDQSRATDVERVECERPPSPEAQAQADEAADAERTRNDPRFREAETMDSAAMATGTWTEREVEQLRTLTRQAPDLSWLLLLQKVTIAINEGKLHPDPELPSWL